MQNRDVARSAPTALELQRRAKEFLPLLLHEQGATEKRSHYSVELHKAFSEAGLYAMLLPSRFGGHQLDIAAYLRVIIAISRGCPSTGLSLAVATSLALPIASLFPEQVQADVFGSGKDVLVSSSDSALPIANSSDGWHVKGVWQCCDGASYATWFLAPVFMPTSDDTGAQNEIGVALVPREHFSVLDDWRDVLGLRGSGAHSISIDTVVPAARVIRGDWLTLANPRHATGRDTQAGAPYDGRGGTLMIRALCAVAVGIGHATLAWYEHILLTRTTPFPPKIPRTQEPNSQRHYGLALGMVESAESILLAAGERHMESSRGRLDGGPQVSGEDELQLIARYHQAINLCWQAVELMFATGGSSAARGDSQMTRYFRDFSTLRTRPELHFEGYARELSRQHFKQIEASKQ